MHCSYEQGGQFSLQQQQQQQQQHVVDGKNMNDEQLTDKALGTNSTHVHKYGHCHHHHKSLQQQQQQTRSNNTTPALSRRSQQQQQQSRNKSTHAHTHSHSHNHSHHASPHTSRHTSPYSHNSHSCHTSPHQSQTHLPCKSPTELQASMQTHAHPHQNHHKRRQKRAHSHSHAHATTAANCSRRHRSVTDISSNSLATLCHSDQQQLLVRKSCNNTNSRTELAQYFAEDLYGSNSRRPSSCCTSSDYCYQTDSTSLYGSRSSHEDSIKSASLQRKRKPPQSYSTISLRARSQPTSQHGSLASIYGNEYKRPKQLLKETLSSDLPEYACSPSPIRWSFLGQLNDEEELLAQNTRKASTASEGRELGYGRHRVRHTSWKKSVDALPSAVKRDHGERNWQKSVDILPTNSRGSNSSWKKSDELPSALKSHSNKRSLHGTKPKKTSWKDNQNTNTTNNTDNNARKSSCEFEESSTTVLFHQEAEAFNNCCSNYIQCNTYLDQDLQITSEDIHQYLNKGAQQGRAPNGLQAHASGTQNYPFQPSNALEYEYKNNFASTNDSDNNCGCRGESNVKSINMESQQVKFINNTSNTNTFVSTEGHHSGYLPYTYPSYDYTNMCSNIKQQHAPDAGSLTSTSDEQHSSLLRSPEPPALVSFESFDAVSEHKLLSPQTPRSDSPVSSQLSAAINPAASGSFVHNHYNNYTNLDYQQQQQQLYQANLHHDQHSHQHQHQHSHSHLNDNFKLSHAFKNVRKRARKYTDFLRKK